MSCFNNTRSIERIVYAVMSHLNNQLGKKPLKEFTPHLSLPWVSVIPYANRREARKLGLLRKQKFRSRRLARVAAGANERVCEEWPTPIVFLPRNLGLHKVLDPTIADEALETKLG